MTIKTACVLAAALSLGACQAFDALTFDADPNSGVAGKAETNIVLVDQGTDLGAISHYYTGFDGLADTLKSSCGAQSRVRGTVSGAVIGGLVLDTAIGAVFDALQSRVDALKAASSKSYSGTLIVDDARTFGFGQPGAVEQCIVVVRRIDTAGQEQMAAAAFVIGVTPRGRAVSGNPTAAVFSPLYARIDKAAAVTRDQNPVDVSIALSVAAITHGKDGPERNDIALGSFTIGALELGESKTWLEKPSAGTGLMALPPASATALELKLAIVETGSALPDFDKAKAEVKAIQDALGPELKARAMKGLGLE